MRRQHERTRGAAVQVERSPVDDRRKRLGQRRLEQQGGELVAPVRLLPGAEQPGLHPPVGGDRFGSMLQHEARRAPGSEVADHADPGVERRVDPEHGGARIAGRTGHDAEHTARVLVVVRTGHRDPDRGILRTEEGVHVLTIV